MFAPIPLDEDFSLRPATPADYEFAHTLTRSNMIGYYRRHGLTWRSDLFLASWNSSENYMIEWADMAIGVLRLDEDADALYVHDIHVISTHRNRGAGTFALATRPGDGPAARAAHADPAGVRRQSGRATL